MRAEHHQLLVAVLIAHQRRDIKGCNCGWSDLGKSHAVHVADMYAAALGEDTRG